MFRLPKKTAAVKKLQTKSFSGTSNHFKRLQLMTEQMKRFGFKAGKKQVMDTFIEMTIGRMEKARPFANIKNIF